jgi:hypothetical protein
VGRTFHRVDSKEPRHRHETQVVWQWVEIQAVCAGDCAGRAGGLPGGQSIVCNRDLRLKDRVRRQEPRRAFGYAERLRHAG